MNATTLPILDLARYSNPAEKAGFLADLRQAARDIGFFYLINHGVDAGLQTEVQRQARRFFALDDSEKQQVAMIHSPPIFAAITARLPSSLAASRTGANSLISALNARL